MYAYVLCRLFRGRGMSLHWHTSMFYTCNKHVVPLKRVRTIPSALILKGAPGGFTTCFVLKIH
jgi:hypothetical protein